MCMDTKMSKKNYINENIVANTIERFCLDRKALSRKLYAFLANPNKYVIQTLRLNTII